MVDCFEQTTDFLMRALFVILNWLHIVFFAKQMARFAATLSRWHIVTSGHSTILEVNPVTPVNIYYLPVEYCLDRDFSSLPNRYDWNSNTVIPRNSWMYIPTAPNLKLDLNVSLRLQCVLGRGLFPFTGSPNGSSSTMLLLLAFRFFLIVRPLYISFGFCE